MNKHQSKTWNFINDTLARISYPGWKFDLDELGNGDYCDGFLLYGQFERLDANTGELGIGTSRKEYLSPNPTEDQIVKTVWVIVQLTVLHEAMEFYKFEGERVFDPHRSVRELAGLLPLHSLSV